jgi:hypothetical protein
MDRDRINSFPRRLQHPFSLPFWRMSLASCKLLMGCASIADALKNLETCDLPPPPTLAILLRLSPATTSLCALLCLFGGNVVYKRLYSLCPLRRRFMSHDDIDAVATCRGGARRLEPSRTAATADNSSTSPAANIRAPSVSLQTMAAGERQQQQQQPSAADTTSPRVPHYSLFTPPTAIFV